jgi:HSP20 family molecular chaperone IbpA
MLDIEQAIREVGSVYQALTGRPIEAGRAVELPAETDPRPLVEGRYQHLKSLLETPARGVTPAPFTPTWAPALSIVELELEVRYELELPAVARDKVSVSAVGAFLVVRGLREDVPAPGHAVRYTERPSGTFQRVIALPTRARRDGIRASLREGVLSITVPTDGPGGAPQPIEVK